MKQLIKDVLDDMSTGQVNFDSPAAREMIANTIMAAIKTKDGWFLDLNTLDGESKLDTPIYKKSDEQKARESWVCDICGKNTFEVDGDYIGSGTNHLGCELKIEMGNKAGINPNDDSDYYMGPDGHYERYGDIPHSLSDDEEVYHIIKHLGYDTKDKKQTVVGKIFKSQLNNLYPRHEEEQ